MEIFVCKYGSPFGKITIAGNEKGLTGLWFAGQKYFGAGLPKDCTEKELPVFEKTKQWLDIYFHGTCPDFMLPLQFLASPFRQKVWKILLTIPYGQTMTYGEIAAVIAKEEQRFCMSAQAVGNAVGHNPISIIVPCHRVVGTNGSLTGYAGGIDKKKKLLELEKVDMSKFFVPKKGTAI